MPVLSFRVLDAVHVSDSLFVAQFEWCSDSSHTFGVFQQLTNTSRRATFVDSLLDS